MKTIHWLTRTIVQPPVSFLPASSWNFAWKSLWKKKSRSLKLNNTLFGKHWTKGPCCSCRQRAVDNQWADFFRLCQLSCCIFKKFFFFSCEQKNDFSSAYLQPFISWGGRLGPSSRPDQRSSILPAKSKRLASALVALRASPRLFVNRTVRPSPGGGRRDLRNLCFGSSFLGLLPHWAPPPHPAG